MLSQVVRRSRIILKNRALFSEVTKSGSQAPSKRDRLQFSKARLVDFGELPYGEIPSALQYSRPTTLKQLSNGVTVTTEKWANQQAAITVMVKAGTRQETLENSSVSQFIARLALQGTQSKSKSEVEQAIDRLGGQIDVSVEREVTRFSILVDQASVNEAVALLADCVLNPVFDGVQVEAEKPAVHKNASSMDPENNAHEQAHYTAFRDHFLGQPVSGIRDNVYSITPQHLKDFHHKYYVGERIVVSGAGNINPESFNEVVSQHFGDVRAKVDGTVDNQDQPFFTPSLMFQRDDELPNTTVSVSFVAPGWSDPDFYAMQYFAKLIGQFRVDKHTGAHLNTPHLQYNSFHTDLGNYADIILHKPFYFPYSDTGLLGNFLFGNEIFNRHMLLMSQGKLTEYAQHINQAEIFRARNSFWNDLLNENCPVAVSVKNSKQAAYLNHLPTRTDIATRISHMDLNFMQNTATKWFWDKEIAVTAWGPLHNVMTEAHYNRPYKRSTLGEYSMVRAKYDY